MRQSGNIKMCWRKPMRSSISTKVPRTTKESKKWDVFVYYLLTLGE
jgi:hypothetical protein